jgi:hypothetical protein
MGSGRLSAEELELEELSIGYYLGEGILSS